MSDIHAVGRVSAGNSFYYCTDYPNAVDTARSKSAGIRKPGSAICFHGNCASLGCTSMENWAFAAVFALLYGHDSAAFGAPHQTIYPFVPYAGMDLKAEAQMAAEYNDDTKKLGAERIESFWRELYGKPASSEPERKDWTGSWLLNFFDNRNINY